MRNNLAGAYRAAGRVGEAIELFEQTLSELVRVLGGDHPHTLASRSDLAGAYRAAGRVAEAVKLEGAHLSGSRMGSAAFICRASLPTVREMTRLVRLG